MRSLFSDATGSVSVTVYREERPDTKRVKFTKTDNRLYTMEE